METLTPPAQPTVAPAIDPAQAARPAPAGRNVRAWGSALVLTVTLINLVLCTWLLVHRPQPIVTFDMKGTLDQFMAQVASQSLTEAQSAQLSARFGQALETSLTDYQREHGALVLVSASVVGGAPDITPQIQQAIALQMRSTPAPAPVHAADASAPREESTP